MAKFIFKTKPEMVKVNGESKTIWLLKSEEFDAFNPTILGLGDISSRSAQVEAIAAIFDLSGFTNFCNQVDPYLSVPEYLSRFLEWLFNKIKDEFLQKTHTEGKELWAELPFLAKFLGDGVLFLWDTGNMADYEIRNVIVQNRRICEAYATDFYPEIRKEVVNPPMALRCGIARGRVFSVGNGNDYVGPCINIASRLQRLGVGFCFSRRGFDIEKMAASAKAMYVLKSTSIRGIGEAELVYLVKEGFDNLPDDEKRAFRTP